MAGLRVADRSVARVAMHFGCVVERARVVIRAFIVCMLLVVRDTITTIE